MIPYKSKVGHTEEDILNVSSIRQKINVYTRKENNLGDDSSMVFLYDKNLGDTTIAGNTDISGNINLETRDLALSYTHIGLHTGD